VHFFFKRLFRKGMDARTLGRVRTATIGPATEQALLQYGITTDRLPETYQAESVVEAFSRENLNGCKVLLPRAKEARTILPQELTRMGAVVDEVAVYQTVQTSGDQRQLIEDLKNDAIDMVTFTSSSTVKNFKSLLPEGAVDLLDGVAIACIGPITAETAKSLGLNSTLVAEKFTIEGLCSAITAYYSGREQTSKTA
jgi:uroporphyrinogen III methyltransferase/synthase